MKTSRTCRNNNWFEKYRRPSFSRPNICATAFFRWQQRRPSGISVHVRITFISASTSAEKKAKNLCRNLVETRLPRNLVETRLPRNLVETRVLQNLVDTMQTVVSTQCRLSYRHKKTRVVSTQKNTCRIDTKKSANRPHKNFLVRASDFRRQNRPHKCAVHVHPQLRLSASGSRPPLPRLP